VSTAGKGRLLIRLQVSRPSQNLSQRGKDINKMEKRKERKKIQRQRNEEDKDKKEHK
jgi:hypothetical protein